MSHFEGSRLWGIFWVFMWGVFFFFLDSLNFSEKVTSHLASHFFPDSGSLEVVIHCVPPLLIHPSLLASSVR